MTHPVRNIVVTCPFRYVSSRKPSPWAAGYHPGIDYKAAVGTAVYAPADAEIIHSGRGGWGSAYGIHVIGESRGTDGKTYRWIIAHLSNEDTTVGKRVRAGDRLGYSGDTGNTFGAHVHFEARRAPFRYADHVTPKVITGVTGVSGPLDKMDPGAYFIGAQGGHVTWLGERIVLHLRARGTSSPYLSGPGPTFTETDRRATAIFQKLQGWTAADADGFPGRETLRRLALAPSAVVPDDPQQDPSPVAEYKILPRSAWTSAPNGRDGHNLTVARVTHMTIHYPADGDTVNNGSLTSEQVAAKLRSYRASHVNKGWADIGYNYAIDQAGRVWFLTGDVIGAHAGEEGNPTSLGVLFVVGNKEQPSPQAIEAFKALRLDKMRRFTEMRGVRGHQQVPGNSTACPGGPLMALIKAGRFLEPPEPIPGHDDSGNEPIPPPTETPDIPDPEVPAEEPDPDLPDFDPAPELPEPPVKVRMRAACGNANVYWMGRWDARVDNVADVFQKAGASVVLCAEMYSGIAGGSFVRELGWGDADNQVDVHADPRRTDSYDVHGGPHAGVKLFAGWDPSKRQVLKVVDFWTTPGKRNSGSMAVLLRDIETKILSIWIPLHLEFEPIGANKPASHWGNKRRYDQAKAAFKKGLALANEWAEKYDVERIPVFVGGDMNGDLDDPFDGPGKAAKEFGFVDSDKVAEKRLTVGGTHATAGGLKPGGRIDRWFVPDWVRVIEQETHNAYPHTDHNVVEIYVEFDNQ